MLSITRGLGIVITAGGSGVYATSFGRGKRCLNTGTLSMLTKKYRRSVLFQGLSTESRPPNEPPKTSSGPPLPDPSPPTQDASPKDEKGGGGWSWFKKKGNDTPKELTPEEKERKRRSERLKMEIRRGYFYEVEELNKTQGKVFETDKEIIPVKSSFPFPPLEAESLLGITHPFQKLLCSQNQLQVSLVALSFRQFGFEMIPGWISPFVEEFAKEPSIKVYQLTLEDKKWMRFLKSLMVRGQKETIDRERHGQCFIRFGDTLDIREGLRIDNRMVAYLFLVDSEGLVRWRGTGACTEKELGYLLKCTHDLLERTRYKSLKEAKARHHSKYGKRKGPGSESTVSVETKSTSTFIGEAGSKS